MRRTIASAFLTFVLVSSLGAATRLQFEWSRVLRGNPLTAPLIEGDNVYVIAQDRHLHIFYLNGRERTTWGGNMRFHPYLMRGTRPGEVYVVTMDNVIHKLVGGKEQWSRRVPFLSGAPSLSEEGYLIVPVAKGGIRVFYVEENTEILSVKGEGDLVLPVISDPWGRFYLATEKGLRSYDSWGNRNWEFELNAKPIAWLFSKSGELVVSLENRDVLTVSLAGKEVTRVKQEFLTPQLLEREDGSLVLINELGRVTITNKALRPRRTRHFGLFVRSAIVLNKEDLLLLSDRYWITVNQRLEVSQVFKGAREGMAVNYSAEHVAAVDTNWTLALFSFKGTPLSELTSWTTDRGDSFRQARVRQALLRVSEDDENFKEIQALKTQFDLTKATCLVKDLAQGIEADGSLGSLSVEKLNQIMQTIVSEGQRRGHLGGLEVRFEIYDALSNIYAPYAHSLLIKYGYWEKELAGTKRLFNALRGMDRDPRGLTMDYLFYAIEMHQANRELISQALDIVEELLDKSVYLNPKKVNNMFGYILRQNVSNEFRERIAVLRPRIKSVWPTKKVITI